MPRLTIAVALSALGFVLVLALPARPEPIERDTVRVIDGDTIRLEGRSIGLLGLTRRRLGRPFASLSCSQLAGSGSWWLAATSILSGCHALAGGAMRTHPGATAVRGLASSRLKGETLAASSFRKGWRGRSGAASDLVRTGQDGVERLGPSFSSGAALASRLAGRRPWSVGLRVVVIVPPTARSVVRASHSSSLTRLLGFGSPC